MYRPNQYAHQNVHTPPIVTTAPPPIITTAPNINTTSPSEHGVMESKVGDDISGADTQYNHGDDEDGLECGLVWTLHGGSPEKWSGHDGCMHGTIH